MSGRVLVVSADPARRRTFRDNLFLAGHAVFDAPNRSSALEACEDFEPSAVVVDLAGSRRRALHRSSKAKPAKTSVDCTLIRQIASRHPAIRVIALCDGEAGSSSEEAVSAGARDYLREPTCIGELLVRVDKHLGISTKVKKVRRPSPRPRRRIIVRSPSAQPPPCWSIPPEKLEAGTVTGPDEPMRLADLVPTDRSTDGATIVWVYLHGLDRIATLGIATYEAVSGAIHSVLERFVPGCSKWWAGSEAIVATAVQIAAPVEAAIELKSAISEELDGLGLATDIALRVSATSRRWGEGRALFLARATGRISNGALPISPFTPGSHPHPSVALPAGVADARIASAEVRSRTTT